MKLHAKLQVTGVLRDETGRIVAHAARNTITAAGVTHAYSRIFGSGDALNEGAMSVRTSGGTNLAAISSDDVGYGPGGVVFTSAFFRPNANFTLGTLDFWSGNTKVWETGTWGDLEAGDRILSAGGSYSVEWLLAAIIDHVEVTDFVPIEGVDHVTARLRFEQLQAGDNMTIASEVTNGERFLAGRWAGVDARSVSNFIVQLWGPDPDSGLPPLEALLAGNAILRETVSQVAVTVGASEVDIEFELPPINQIGAFGYRYGVLRVGAGILSLADLGPRGHPGSLADPTSHIYYSLKSG